MLHDLREYVQLWTEGCLILPQRGIAVRGWAQRGPQGPHVVVCVGPEGAPRAPCGCVRVCVWVWVWVGREGPETFREPPGTRPPAARRPPLFHLIGQTGLSSATSLAACPTNYYFSQVRGSF